MEPYARSVELVLTNREMFARVVRQIRTLQHKAHSVCAMPGSWQEMQDNVYQQRVQRMNISTIHWYGVKTALLYPIRQRQATSSRTAHATLGRPGPTEHRAQTVLLESTKLLRETQRV